jgi:hypothetical protein
MHTAPGKRKTQSLLLEKNVYIVIPGLTPKPAVAGRAGRESRDWSLINRTYNWNQSPGSGYRCCPPGDVSLKVLP